MVIAYDAKRAFQNRRGLGNYSRDVIRLMSAYYPETRLVLAGTPSTQLMDIPGNATVVEPIGAWRMAKGLWRSAGGMNKQIKQSGAEIYHGLSQELPWGIHHTKLKTIVTFHDALFMRYPQNYSFLYRKTFELKNRYALRTADRIIAITEQSKLDAIEFFGADPDKITVVYQGCNKQFRQPENNGFTEQIRRKYNLPGRYLLQVGAIEPNKNLQTILRALPLLDDKEIKLVVVGRKSAYAVTMQKLAAELGVAHRLVYCHEAEFTDLPAFYHGAEVFLFPSFFEGFGIPIIEAQCCGTPVVTSWGGCFPETAGQGALFVKPDYAEQMAEAINLLLTDSELREQLTVLGHKNTERFTDDKVAGSLMAVYKQLVP